MNISNLKNQVLAGFKNKNIRLIFVMLLLLLIIEIYYWTQSGLFNWPALIVILEVILIIFAFSKDSVKKIIGEYKHPKRGRLRWFISWYLLMFLLAPFSIYLVHELSQHVPAAQLSVLVIAPTLGGLVLTAASNSRITNKTHSELIHVARKLISATLLFVFFVPFIFIVDQLGGIDIYSLAPNLLDPQTWSRGLFFWLAVPCFYVGVFLFILGLIDLVFALRDFSTIKSRRQVKKKSKKTPLS